MNRCTYKSRYGELWTHDESVLAFDLYCKIPFHKTKSNNPAVIELARILGRTPASIARKLGNFGAFDPALRKINISGLTHTSKLDQAIWEEFHRDWDGLVWEANNLRNKLESIPAQSSANSFMQPTGSSETVRLTKQRVHQRFFREAILSSYETTCCVTGIAISDCLVASHIIPWSEASCFRTDPTNGLCLSATFDRLFDAGLMSITDDLVICFSSQIVKSKESEIRDLLLRYHKQPIRKPRRFFPNPEHLAWHRRHQFKN